MILPRDSIRARLIGLAMALTGVALVAGYLAIAAILEDFIADRFDAETGAVADTLIAGADDYAVKPFRLEEVVIRAQTLVRRAAGHAQPVIAAGALRLDSQLGVITRDGLALKLTAFEQRILSYLIHHKNRIVSRTELAEHLYDANADRDFKSIEVVIGRLRKKTGEGVIETRRGEGYVLRDAPAGAS